MKNVELHVGFQLRFWLVVQISPDLAQIGVPPCPRRCTPRARRNANASSMHQSAPHHGWKPQPRVSVLTRVFMKHHSASLASPLPLISPGSLSTTLCSPWTGRAPWPPPVSSRASPPLASRLGCALDRERMVRACVRPRNAAPRPLAPRPASAVVLAMHGRAATLGEPLLTTARARLATSPARLALAAGLPAAAGQAPPTAGRRFAALVPVRPPLPKPSSLLDRGRRRTHV
jgi:hypothetical protein